MAKPNLETEVGNRLLLLTDLHELGSESKVGRLVIVLDPTILSVSDAITHLASQTELIDVSVSGITAEEMVALLYKEYKI